MSRQRSLRVDIWLVCRRYMNRKHRTPMVDAARRVMREDPTPSTVHQWLEDLQLLIENAMPPAPLKLSWKTALTEEAAARRIQRLLDAEGIVELLERERVA